MDPILAFLITITSIAFGGLCILYIVKQFMSIPENHYHFELTVKQEQQPVDDPSDILSFDVSHAEYHKVLNFMLLYGLIENDEFQRLQSSAAPYLTQDKVRW
jgi:type II secretory pathway component PulC